MRALWRNRPEAAVADFSLHNAHHVSFGILVLTSLTRLK
jgi:hypothetical protein